MALCVIKLCQKRFECQGGAPDSLGTALHAALAWMQRTQGMQRMPKHGQHDNQGKNLWNPCIAEAVLRGDAELVRLLCSRSEWTSQNWQTVTCPSVYQCEMKTRWNICGCSNFGLVGQNIQHVFDYRLWGATPAPPGVAQPGLWLTTRTEINE